MKGKKLNKNFLKDVRIADLLAEVPEAVVLTKESITFIAADEMTTIKIDETEYEDTRLVLINFDGI